MRRILLCAVMAMVSTRVVAAEVREPLAMFEGEWTVEGREETFRETCEWFHQRSHIVCNSESRGAKGLRRGVSVMSYSEEKRRFVYYHYGSSGVVVAQDLFVDGNRFLAIGQQEEGNDVVRTQVRITPRPDGSFDLVEETSRNGGAWTKSAEVHYVRRNAAAGGSR